MISHMISGILLTKTMIIIMDYSLECKVNSSSLYVKSKEVVSCPCCDGRLIVCGSRKRGLFRVDGSYTTLVIRVLQCVDCERTHRELPDIVVPYKRYESDVIEMILADTEHRNKLADYPCEQRTAIRIKLWFYLIHSYFEGIIRSLKEIFQLKTPVTLPLYPLSNQPAGWLRYLVRSVVNSSRWQQVCSA